MDDKKYFKRVGDKIIGYGAKGYRISPGTSKGDRYCACSYGQLLKYPDTYCLMPIIWVFYFLLSTFAIRASAEQA